MGAVRFLRACRSPLRWLEVLAGLFLFHFIKSLQAEVLWSEKGRAQPRLLTTSGGFYRPLGTSLLEVPFAVCRCRFVDKSILPFAAAN